jgi:hypothetical protein
MQQTTEQMIQERGLNAPRVTKEEIDRTIIHTEIVKHITPAGKILRWAVLTCENGYAVTGKPSAAVSVENDNQEVGEKVAIDNAKAEMWALLGYQLQTSLMLGKIVSEAVLISAETH